MVKKHYLGFVILLIKTFYSFGSFDGLKKGQNA
jgi:hypothetical protein